MINKNSYQLKLKSEMFTQSCEISIKVSFDIWNPKHGECFANIRIRFTFKAFSGCITQIVT